MKSRRNVLGYLPAVLTVGLALLPTVAFAQSGEPVHREALAGLAAAIAIGLAALGGTLAQGKAVSSGLDAIGRNPAASGKLFVPMLLGLAFIESLVILAFVIAFMLKP